MKIDKYGESDDYTNTVKFKISEIEGVVDFDSYIDYQSNKDLIERAFNLKNFYPYQPFSDPFSYLNQKTISMKISNVKDVEIGEDTLFGINNKYDNSLATLVTLDCYPQNYQEIIKSNTRCIEVIVNYPIHVDIPHIFKGDIYSFYLYEDIISESDPCTPDYIYEFR